MAIDNHDLYHLKLLQHVEHDHTLTNRLVSRKLDVSVRLAHDILKKMVEKGLLHVKVIHSRRWDYFLTPKGIMEKARLTMEFFEFSMHFYHEARKRSADVCRELSRNGSRTIGFLGAGDLAEITFLGVQEWRLNLTSVYDYESEDRSFINLPITPMKQLRNARETAIVVCMYDKKQPMASQYLPPGVEDNGTFRWIF